MFEKDVKMLPKKIFIPHEEEQQEEVKLQPQRTPDGRLVVGYVENHEQYNEAA